MVADNLTPATNSGITSSVGRSGLRSDRLLLAMRVLPSYWSRRAHCPDDLSASKAVTLGPAGSIMSRRGQEGNCEVRSEECGVGRRSSVHRRFHPFLCATLRLCARHNCLGIHDLCCLPSRNLREKSRFEPTQHESPFEIRVHARCYLATTEKRFQMIPSVRHKSICQNDLISHGATEITKSGLALIRPSLCGFVPLCELDFVAA